MNSSSRDSVNGTANEVPDGKRNAAASAILDCVHQEADAMEVEDAFRQASRRGICFRSFDWRRFADATRRANNVQLLDCVCTAWFASATRKTASEWVRFARAAGQVGNGELLRVIWRAWKQSKAPLEPKGLGQFIVAAASTEQVDLIAEIWATCKASRRPVASRSWTKFAGAAWASGSGDLLRDMWATCCSSNQKIGPSVLDAFASAAMVLSQLDLVPEIWAASQGTCQPRGSRTWRELASAAAKPGSGPFVRELWSAWHTSGAELGPPGLGAFAAAAGSTEQGDLLQEIWEVCHATEAQLGSRTWGALAAAAGKTGRPELLREIWVSWAASGDHLAPHAWARFATAAGRTSQRDLLTKLWLTWNPSRSIHEQNVWTSIAAAAEDAQHTELLDSVVRACIAMDTPLSHHSWGSLANSAANTDLPDLIHPVWRQCRKLSTPIDARTIGLFAGAARSAKNSKLLEDIFDAWDPGPDTLIRREQFTWISLMLSALSFDNESLFLKIFLRLESLYDPIRLSNRGSIQNQLWQIVRGVKSPEIRNRVLEDLRSLRLDVERCFRTLRTVPPAEATAIQSGRFEGAGRCLMIWLVNSYFHTDFAEFERRLARLVDGILTLEDHRTEAWHAMLCRGQGAFAGCLVARATEHLEQAMEPIATLSDDQLVAAMEQRDGSIFARLRQFYLHDVDAIPTPQVLRSVPRDSAARRLDPFIAYVVDRHLEFLAGETLDKCTYFGDAWKILSVVPTAELSREDWMDAVRTLLARMTAGVWNHVGRNIKDQVHAHKNEWELFATEMRSTDDLETRRQLAQVGRRTFLSFNQLGGFSIHQPVPVHINRHIRHLLLNKQPETRTIDIDIPEERILIGGWNGVVQRVVRPLLQEIRLNAETALSHLPPNEQMFRVRLEIGSGPKRGFAVLVVSNTYDPDAPEQRFSTRRGQRVVQLLATFLRLGSRQGYAWAEVDTDESGRHVHTWWLLMPCWDENAVEVGHATG